jgi:hypothetical protein
MDRPVSGYDGRTTGGCCGACGSWAGDFCGTACSGTLGAGAAGLASAGFCSTGREGFIRVGRGCHLSFPAGSLLR